MRIPVCFIAVSLWTMSQVSVLHAGLKTILLGKGIQAATRKGGQELSEEGLERLPTKLSGLAARQGDDAMKAASRRLGLSAARVAGELTENSDLGLRLLAAHGDRALPLVARPKSLALIHETGEDAEKAFLRHGSAIAEPIVSRFGLAGARTLGTLSEVNGRRLAILTRQHNLPPDLLEQILGRGDRCCEWVWKNKLVLFGTASGAAAIQAFLASPEDFLNGTATWSSAVLDPLVDIPKTFAIRAAERIDWTVLAIGWSGVLFAIFVLALALVRFKCRWLRPILRFHRLAPPAEECPESKSQCEQAVSDLT